MLYMQRLKKMEYKSQLCLKCEEKTTLKKNLARWNGTSLYFMLMPDGTSLGKLSGLVVITK